MASLKEIKNRIASVASTQQTTSAMKMISASKLRKTQAKLQHLRPFAEQLHHVMLKTLDENVMLHSPFLETRKTEKVLLIVVTSNSGLCGAFNTTVLKAALNHIKTTYQTNPDIKEISIACFGKKAVDFFAKQPYKVVENQIDIMANLDYTEFDKIAENWLQAYKNHTYDLVEMICNEFVNAATYKTTIRKRLPFNLKDIKIDDFASNDFLYMPDKNVVIHNIIPMSFKIRAFMRLVESATAEYAARMTSMHKATENAIVLEKELKLRYNKARQAAITNEIIEITTGANALKTK